MLDSNLYFQANLLYDFHKLGVDWLKVSRRRNTLKLIAEFKITRFLNQLLKRRESENFLAGGGTYEKRDMNKYGPSYHFKPFLLANARVELIKNATVYLGDEFCIHKQPSELRRC